MIGVSIWVSIVFGGPVEIGGNVTISAPVRAWTDDRFAALTIPHVTIMDPTQTQHAFAHEQVHHSQFDALGPAQPLSYLLSLGRPFEDFLGGPDMWEGDELRCPAVRVDGGVEFMPCWRF